MKSGAGPKPGGASGTRRPRRISAAAREAILEAAEAEFAKYGFGGARAQRIANRARVNKALPFYHFGSKADLYEEVLKRSAERFAQQAIELYQTEAGPKQRLAWVLRQCSAYLSASPNWSSLALRELLDQGPRARLFTERYLRPTIDLVRARAGENIRLGLLREVEPLQILVSIFGEVVLYFLLAPILESMGLEAPQSAETLAARERTILELMERGLRGPRAPLDGAAFP